MTLGLVAFGCSATPQPIDAPATSSSASIAKSTSSAPAETPLVRVTPGEGFVVDPNEPLPKGAVARCGTTRMHAAFPVQVAVTNEGTVWALDRLGTGTMIRDATRGVDVGEVPAASKALFSPNLRFVVSSSWGQDAPLRFHSLPDGKPAGEVTLTVRKRTVSVLGRLLSESGRILEIRISGDDQTVAVLGSDHQIFVVDAAQKKVRKTLSVDAKWRLVGVSKAGDRALFEVGATDAQRAASFDAVLGFAVLDLKTGATVRKSLYKTSKDKVLPEHEASIHRLALSGQSVFRLEPDGITAIDLASGAEKRVATGPFGSGSVYTAFRDTQFELRPDDRHAIVDKAIVDLTGSEKSAALPRGFMAFSPDGAWTVTSVFRRLHRSPRDVEVGDAAEVGASDIAFLADNHLVVSGTEARAIDSRTCSRLHPEQRLSGLGVAAASGVPLWVTSADPPVLVDKANHTTPLAPRKPSLRSVGLSPDGQWLLSASREADGTPGHLRLEKLPVAAGLAVDKPAFEPDPRTRSFNVPVVSAGLSPDADLVVVSTGARMGPGKHAVSILSSEDLRTRAEVNVERAGLVAFAGRDRVVHASPWSGLAALRVNDLQPVLAVREGGCCEAAALSPDGALAAGANGDTLFVWDLSARRLLARVPRAHREPISSLAFSSDNRFLATSSLDTTVLLWDLSKMPVPGAPFRPAPPISDPAEMAKWLTPPGPDGITILQNGTLRAPAGSKIALPPLRSVTRLAGRYGSYCAVASREVLCWGSTHGGVLGIPEEKSKSSANPAVRATPVKVPVSDAVDVQMVGFYSCALTAAGDVICWGMLGEAGVFPPKKVIGDVKALALEGDVPHVIDRSGAVWTWDGDHVSPRATTLKDATLLRQGNAHTCALTTSGAVFCRGANDRDQLGDNTGVDQTEPVRVVGVREATGLAVEDDLSCAVTKAGEVWCWGQAPEGHAPIPTAIAPLRGATEVAIRGAGVCGKKGDHLECVTWAPDPERGEHR